MIRPTEILQLAASISAGRGQSGNVRRKIFLLGLRQRTPVVKGINNNHSSTGAPQIGQRERSIVNEISLDDDSEETVNQILMTTIPPDKNKTIDAIKTELSLTNPFHRIGGDEYRRNCQRCVMAYEMRRRGYDVIARPRVLDGTDRLPVMISEGGWLEVFQGAKPVFCGSPYGVNECRANVEKQMEEWGDGARAIIRVIFDSGGGHVFCVERVNGETVFSDPQTGEYDCSRYFSAINPNHTYLVRVDNLEPTELIGQCCASRRLNRD